MDASTLPRALPRHLIRMLAILLMLGLSSCISTTLVEQWRDPGFTAAPLHRVLVVAVQRDAGGRRLWESAMVDALMRQHIAATASYRLFPYRAPSPGQLAAAARAQHFDGVLATHFIGTREGLDTVPAYAGPGLGWGWRYYGYWRRVYGPTYIETEYQSDFQTDVFTAAPNGGKLIWSGTTRSVDLSSAAATTDQISRVLVPTLVRERLLTPS